MSERQKKHGVAYCATVLMVVGLLYVASFGMWCRYNRTGPGEISAARAYVFPYYPIFWLADNGPAPVRSALRAYIIWCLS
jgi:hypothetical protein